MITLLQVIQCGRHNDIFKFWLAWRAKGSLGFESQMNRCRSWQLECTSASKSPIRRFVITQKAPTRAFYWLDGLQL